MKKLFVSRFLLIALVALSFGLLGAFGMVDRALAASKTVFKQGNWNGKVRYSDKTGKFSNCTMSARYKSGFTLTFIITGKFNWGIGLIKPGLNLTKGVSIPVDLFVDGRSVQSSNAKVLSPSFVLVPLKNSTNVVRAIRNGRVLTITTGSTRARFNLNSTRRAVSRLASCVKNYRNTTQNAALNAGGPANGRTTANGPTAGGPTTGGPAAGGPTTPRSSSPLFSDQNTPKPAPKPIRAGGPKSVNAGGPASAPLPATRKRYSATRRIKRDQAIVWVSNTLSKAGVTGYRIVDPTKHSKRGYDVMWVTPDGVIGAMAVFLNSSRLKLDSVASQVVANDSKICTGDVASGKKKPESIGLTTFRHVFVACEQDTKSFEARYILAKTQNGTIVKIAHLLRGKKKEGTLQAAREKILRGVDWTKVDGFSPASN